MHEKTINSKTKHVFKQITQSGIVKDFYLAGGTALALQLGHRVSIDLDWFSEKDFLLQDMIRQLEKVGALKVVGQEEGTLHVELDGVKMSFLRYSYSLLYQFVVYADANLADPRDIACMKLDAVSSRGSKKDFIDLYFLLERYSLDELLGFFERKYSGAKYSYANLVKSLTYFQDAEADPMPEMLESVSWEEVKENVEQKVREEVDGN